MLFPHCNSGVKNLKADLRTAPVQEDEGALYGAIECFHVIKTLKILKKLLKRVTCSKCIAILVERKDHVMGFRREGCAINRATPCLLTYKSSSF